MMDLVNLQSGYLLRVFDPRTLYFILYYYFHRFSILSSLSFHVIAFSQASQIVHENIIIFTHQYYIAFKHHYQFLGPV
jgi:hypothetical protein